MVNGKLMSMRFPGIGVAPAAPFFFICTERELRTTQEHLSFRMHMRNLLDYYTLLYHADKYEYA